MSVGKKIFWGALLGGGAYFLFSKKGKEIQEELAKKMPDMMAEVKKRVAAGRETIDDAIEDVVDEWKHAQKIMAESAAPIRRELKRRARAK